MRVTGDFPAIRPSDGPVSLEGRLRELGLPEVLQLLGLSRKTGTLHVRTQVHGRAAFVRLAQGAVVDAAQWRLEESNEPTTPDGLATDASAVRAVEACVLDLLTWREGEFRFAPEESAASSPVRLAIEMLLVEAAQRAEGWDRVADRIPHARVVPAFADVEPQQLPLLHLVAPEWEILTRVDGRRDLTELAAALGREVLDVAAIVHGLLAAGLLTLRDAESVPRRNPTPPTAHDAVSRAQAPVTDRTSDASPLRDLWIPRGDDGLDANDVYADDDSLFDPIETGVLNPDGTPRRRTTPFGVAALRARPTPAHAGTVANVVTGTSLPRGEASGPLPGTDAMTLAAQGDDAARRGDFTGALTFWSAALRSEASLADADRIREAIALVARLHALLHPAARHA